MKKFPKHSTNYILVTQSPTSYKGCQIKEEYSCVKVFKLLPLLPSFGAHSLFPNHRCMLSSDFPDLSCLPLVAVAYHLEMLPYFTVECFIHIHAPPDRLQVPASHTALWLIRSPRAGGLFSWPPDSSQASPHRYACTASAVQVALSCFSGLFPILTPQLFPCTGFLSLKFYHQSREDTLFLLAQFSPRSLKLTIPH